MFCPCHYRFSEKSGGGCGASLSEILGIIAKGRGFAMSFRRRDQSPETLADIGCVDDCEARQMIDVLRVSVSAKLLKRKTSEGRTFFLLMRRLRMGT